MKKKRFLRKLSFYCGLAAFLLLPLSNYGQTVKRQCISSYGSVASQGGVYVAQTAGQSYGTANASADNNQVLQGFQQSGSFVLQNVESGMKVDLNLQVYPNPATYRVVVEGKTSIENYHIDVSDSQGRIFVSEQINGLSYELNCEPWLNGIYFISISDLNNNKQTLKLVISK